MTWLTQQKICALAAFITAALCLILLFSPGVIFWLFNMPNDEGGAFMARRASMLFAGLSFLSWRSKDLPESAALKVIFFAFAIIMGGLASIGIIEFLRGGVGYGIALAVVTEIFFLGVFLTLAKRIS